MKHKKLTLVFLIGVFFLMVSTKKVNAATSDTLKLNHDSYVYNSKGKRVGKTVIKKNKKINPVKKVEKVNKEKRYFIFKNKIGVGVLDTKSLYWLPYKKIKNDYYYQIGRNKYIKCINVKFIGNSYVYASDARIKIRLSNYASNDQGKRTNYNVKENKEYTVDRQKFLPESILTSYRIKGTNYWVNAGYIEGNPRQALLPFNIKEKPYVYISISKDNTLVYNSNGNPQLNVTLFKSTLEYEAKSTLYIWNPVDNKAELYYQLSNQKVYGIVGNTGNNDEVLVKEGYIKASDVKIEAGNGLTPSNTPEQAKAIYEASLAK